MHRITAPLGLTCVTLTDNKPVPGEVGALLYLAVPCFVLAVIFHPGLNSHFLADTTWAFSMYLESVAMLPQLYMFQKQVRPSVSHTQAQALADNPLIIITPPHPSN